MRQEESTLRHWLAAILVVFSATLAFGPARAQQQTVLQIQATTVDALREWDAYVTQRERTGRLRVVKTEQDPLLPARTIERLQQYHQGVPIWGAEVVRDSESGVSLSIFGALSPDLTLGVVPALSPQEGRAALLATLDGASLLSQPALVIVRLDSGEHRLAYMGVVAGGIQVVRVFVDADNGSELLRYSEIHTQQSVGTGTGVLGDRKKLSVWSQAGGYVAFDTHRPPVLETLDMLGNLSRAKSFVLFGSVSVADLAFDFDNEWVDVAVVDAHAHVAWTYDYFFKRFGRSGLDGQNGPINVLTNASTQQGALTMSAQDLDLWARNAFWCGVCLGGQGVMVFGNGIPPGLAFVDSGQNVTYLAGSLDIAAHELTHGVTDRSSGLIGQSESGALNEAFSDIMGTSVEFFYQQGGTGLRTADYVIGEDSFRPALPGSVQGIRSMANPRAYGDPDHYAIRFTGTFDSGGVHINSGIANNAFYLAIEGGTNSTSGLTVQGVGAANRLQIERVFFRAFVSLLPANATFSIARAATVQAARDLYGTGSAVETAITQAWTAVGVF